MTGYEKAKDKIIEFLIYDHCPNEAEIGRGYDKEKCGETPVHSGKCKKCWHVALDEEQEEEK